MPAPQPALRPVPHAPGLKHGHAVRASITVVPQVFPLLSIDYAQGETDLNFAFFFGPSLNRRRQRRRLHVVRITDALHRAAQQFPTLLGRVVCDSSAGWRVVVDPDDINWPVVTEVRTCGPTIAALKRSGFAWDAWPSETRSPDLRTLDSLPMLGVHIVHYPCGGSSLHTKVRHQVMDGNGVWRFYEIWASTSAAELRGHQLHKSPASMGSFIAGNPLLDRALLADRFPRVNNSTEGSAGSTDAAREYMDGLVRLFREAAQCAP
ncbi:hypothetical protein IWQ56_002695, partial [Coemansia nantahalensis]